jgi:hypothetical protein
LGKKARTMNENPKRNTQPGMPVERHLTAAWAEICDHKPVSNVTIPSLEGIAEAKGYVDENEK